MYGFRDVTTEDKEKLRRETLLTLRIANVMDVLCRRGIPWVIGAPVRDGPSPFPPHTGNQEAADAHWDYRDQNPLGQNFGQR